MKTRVSGERSHRGNALPVISSVPHVMVTPGGVAAIRLVGHMAGAHPVPSCVLTLPSPSERSSGHVQTK